jgi:8-oxo-dGTP diphosphatase
MINELRKKQKISVGVLGLPVNRHGEYLITLRNEPKLRLWHNRWQITGGTMEFGETPEETLSREMKEELNVSVRIIYPYPMTEISVWEFPNKHFQVLLLCYLVDIGSQTPQVDHQENSDYQWIKPSRINQLKFLPQTDKFILTAESLVNSQNLLNSLSNLPD